MFTYKYELNILKFTKKIKILLQLLLFKYILHSLLQYQQYLATKRNN